MTKFHMKYFGMLGIIFILASCGEQKQKEVNLPNKEKEKAPKTIPVKKKEEVSEVKKPEIIVNRSFKDSLINETLKVLKLDYDEVPYFTEIGNTLYFTVKGDWISPKNRQFNRSGRFVVGLVDQYFNSLLAPEYSLIGNPDVIAKGFIEINKGGYVGLFNYQNNLLISPKFDLIYPSEDENIIAIGKVGNKFFEIDPEGNEKEVSKYLPDVKKQIKDWGKILKFKKITFWRSPKNFNLGEHDPWVADGVVFTPNHIKSLNFLNEIYTNIYIEKDADFGILGQEVFVAQETKIIESFKAFFTSYYETGSSGRGWSNEENFIITLDSKNQMVGSKHLLTEEYQGRYCGTQSVKFVGEQIVEVLDLKRYDEEFQNYSEMNVYKYYRINKEGGIDKLESDRFFDFTKFIELKDYHFKGCFTKERVGENLEGDENLIVTKHLSIEDLDIMRNEIFAEYGYIFKSEKWQNYFNQKIWYNPVYDNVDHLLTEIDKQNIKFILEAKEKMLKDEKKYTEEHLVEHYPAG